MSDRVSQVLALGGEGTRAKRGYGSCVRAQTARGAGAVITYETFCQIKDHHERQRLNIVQIVISSLVEGNSIRSTERMTGVPATRLCD